MARTIETPCGPITGTTCEWPHVEAYKGIRYATAKRWEYPTVVTHWDGVYDASHYGNCSYQPRAFYDEAKVPEKAFYYNEFRKGETYTYSEDCLFLNIWIPEGAKPEEKLPVLFYIHGGGFTGGCGHEKHFDGPVWPTMGVIGVTINYRLGPMGFMALPELKEEAGHTGNYALFDQLAALKWIRTNISFFGGDPDNITIMGQSAGAMSVQQFAVSPLTDGLFAKAVMSSGGGVSKMMNMGQTQEEQYPFWQAVQKKSGAATLEEFRSLPPASLFAAWDAVKKQNPGMMLSASPCVDGVFLKKSALDVANEGGQKNVPYLAGTTSEDIVPPIVHKMAKDWCRRQSDEGKQKSYAWFFDRRLPGDDCGAWHSSDLWYWFGTLDHCWRPMTQKDYDLSHEMAEYLTNFAKTGNPNGERLVSWLPVEKGQNKVLRLGEGATRMGGVNIAKLNYTMTHNVAVGE